MPYFKYTAKSPAGYRISYYWEVPVGVMESATTKCMDDDKGKKGHTSSSSYKTKYEMLSHSLKSCLDYCALLCRCGYDYKRPEKERIVKMMVAEGLIEEKGSCLEEVASSMMDELTAHGMLIQYFDSYSFTTWIEIPEEYYKFCVVERDEEDFLARNPLTSIRVSVFAYYYDGNIGPLLENLPIQSLFFRTIRISDQAIIDTIAGLSSLVVLRCRGSADDHILLNKIGELINLKFFSLSLEYSSPYMLNLSNFHQLQTLELNTFFDSKVVEETQTIKTLRHFSCGGRLVKGIGRQINLQSLVGWDARSEFTEELSSLNQLLYLDVYNVGDENINKLLETIASMKTLVHLSMRASVYSIVYSMFPLLEPFSPPTHLQQLFLIGKLMELPDWIASMENLTTLVLTYSDLTEDPSIVFQFLPNLKFLGLIYAYEAKFIGKEFCKEGGFPKLEKLEIWSDDLVGWSEIVERAFPSLTSLILKSSELRFFPKGVQHLSKLERLELKAHGDLIRLLNGEENYKIKHIASVSMYSYLDFNY